MKVHVTMPTERQIGADTFQSYTAVMDCDEKTTIEEINDWVRTIDQRYTVAVQVVIDRRPPYARLRG